jgi:hypothetical protein
MSKKLRTTGLLALAALLGLLATNCSKPVAGEKEMLGKIKGKASLRLADGSTISRDDSDEYSPYLIKMDDGHLVLVFGSNRTDCGSCTAHNLFVARSLTTFDGVNLPFFATPAVLNISVTPWNSVSQIKYAVKKNGTGLRVFVNLPTVSDFIHYADISNPSSPTISGWSTITNSTRESDAIVGISADGTNLYTTEVGVGTGYAFDPMSGATANPFGYGLNSATSATQVRQENSGYEDAILGVYYSSTYSAAGEQYFGPIIGLNTSLAFSGLMITSLSTFAADDPANDIVLFSAFDYFEGFTEDLYVITSHTSKDLWDESGFPGYDYLPTNPPPTPDHHYAFESAIWSTCSAGTAIDFGFPQWNGDCSNVTFSSPSYDFFSEFGQFGGTSQVTLGAQDVGSTFTISAWVYLTGSPTCNANCPILANDYMAAAADGFRFYIDASNGKLAFDTGLASSSLQADSVTFVIPTNQWYHVAVTVDRNLETATLYVDGSDVTNLSSTQPGFTTSATTALRIGMNADNDGFTGDMDDVMIFSRVLDPAEIAELAMNF